MACSGFIAHQVAKPKHCSSLRQARKEPHSSLQVVNKRQKPLNQEIAEYDCARGSLPHTVGLTPHWGKAHIPHPLGGRPTYFPVGIFCTHSTAHQWYVGIA